MGILDVAKAFEHSFDDIYRSVSEKRDSLMISAFRHIGINLLWMNPQELESFRQCVRVDYTEMESGNLKREFYINDKLKFTIIDNFNNLDSKCKFDIYFEEGAQII